MADKSFNSKLRLYALGKLRVYSEDLELAENEDIAFDKNLFIILINLLKDHYNALVKYEVMEIFLNLSHKSKEFSKLFLDTEYIDIITSYLESYDERLVDKSLSTIGNILIYDKDAYDFIRMIYPLDIKLKEFLLTRKYEKNIIILSNIIWALQVIVQMSNPESLGYVINKIQKTNFTILNNFQNFDILKLAF